MGLHGRAGIAPCQHVPGCHRREDHAVWSQGRSDAINVPVTTVDCFLQDRSIERIDLMKMDVEGFEFSVLQGAKESLAAGRIHMVQFEFNQMNVHSRTFFRDFKELLRDFAFYRILNNGVLLSLADQPTPLLEIFAQQNIVVIRRGNGTEWWVWGSKNAQCSGLDIVG